MPYYLKIPHKMQDVQCNQNIQPRIFAQTFSQIFAEETEPLNPVKRPGKPEWLQLHLTSNTH